VKWIYQVGFCNHGNEHLNFKRTRKIAMFEVLTGLKSEVVVFWVVTLCSNVVVYRRFGEPCCLHIYVETPVPFHITTRRYNQ
jgi:hypothetical protein